MIGTKCKQQMRTLRSKLLMGETTTEDYKKKKKWEKHVHPSSTKKTS